MVCLGMIPGLYLLLPERWPPLLRLALVIPVPALVWGPIIGCALGMGAR